MEAYDEPMFYDEFVSMPLGPVVSITYNFIGGENQHPTWSRFIGKREEHVVRVSDGVTAADFDHLSEADLEILDGVWQELGGMDQFELVKFMHDPDKRPEWQNPHGSSRWLSHERVFDKLGKKSSEELAEDVELYRNFKQQSAAE